MLADSEQRLLEESLGVVGEQTYIMKQSMESGNIRDVLKHSSTLIAELRTSALSPRKYYELYIQVFQELQHLHAFFCDRNRRRRRLGELYESVQHAGNVLPRLYLLVCVGAACIKEREISPRETLIDLNELCKGIQQPTRGLFLRYFLVQMVKNVLPDVGDPEYLDWPAPPSLNGEAPITSAEVSFEFLFTNSVEATKLWTRIQFQSPTRDRARRENDRHSLRVLVGANMVCMSQLESMTVGFYKELGLPRLLNHLKGLKDIMSQQYLLECIVQVFSDECHIATLQMLFDAIVHVSSAGEIPVSNSCERWSLVLLARRLALFHIASMISVVELYIETGCFMYVVDTKPILVNLFTRLKAFLTSSEAFQTDSESEKREIASKKKENMTTENSHHQLEDLRGASCDSSVDSGIVTTRTESFIEGETTINIARTEGSPQTDHSANGLTTHIMTSTPIAEDPSMAGSTSTATSYNTEAAVSLPMEQHPQLQPVDMQDKQDDKVVISPQTPPQRLTSSTDLHQEQSFQLPNSQQQQSPIGNQEPPVSPTLKKVKQSLIVFATIREGLMDLIQKAYDEDFKFPPPEIPIKPSNVSKIPPIYRLGVTDILQILKSFLDFTLTTFSERVDLVDSVYQLVYPLVAALKAGMNDLKNSNLENGVSNHQNAEALVASTSIKPTSDVPVSITFSQALGDLLSEPFRQPGFVSLLHGKHYSRLLECLNDDVKVSVARDIVGAMLKAEEVISDPTACATLYSLLHFVISSPRPKTSTEGNQWLSEIQTACGLCHLIQDDDTDLQFSMLLSVKQSLMSGHRDTFAYTLPPLITCWLSSIPKIQLRELSFQHDTDYQQESIPVLSETSPRTTATDEPQFPSTPECSTQPKGLPDISTRRVLQQVHSTCVDLVEYHPEMAFRLLLLAAEATVQADHLQPGSLSMICNEFIKQALVCYEEDLTDNRCRVRALPLLVGLLSSTGRTCLDIEAYESLSEKATRHAAKLLKSSDQCRAVLLCTHLFWDSQNESRRDISRVLECLQRCFKLATDAVQFNALDVVLFVDILEKYLYYFETGPNVGGIPAEAVSSLMGLCAEQLAFAESSSSVSSDSAREQIRSTQRHLLNFAEYVRACGRADVNSKFHRRL